MESEPSTLETASADKNLSRRSIIIQCKGVAQGGLTPFSDDDFGLGVNLVGKVWSRGANSNEWIIISAVILALRSPATPPPVRRLPVS